MKASSVGRTSITSMKELGIEMESPAMRRRLTSLCRLTRQIFTAFEGDPSLDMMSEGIARRWLLRRAALWLVRLDAFGGLFAMLTLWALFGPDVCLLYGCSVRYTPWLAAVNTGVLGLFFSEGVLNCLAFDDYPRSIRFWVDLLATLSMVGDTWIGNELVPTDAAAAGKGSRFTRLLKLGGRSSRLLRLARTARIVQVLRIVPRMVSLVNQGRRDIANILVHKRLWRLFQFLDVEQSGQLTQAEMDLFDRAMEMEFPSKQPRDSIDGLVATLHDVQAEVSSVRQRASRTLSRIGSFFLRGARASVDKPEYGTFRVVADSFLLRPEGKVAIARCEKDLQCIKDSCTMMQQASAQMALKICFMVLALVAMSTMLEVDVEERGDIQALAHLASAVSGTPCSNISGGTSLSCRLVSRFAQDCRHALVFLALNRTVQWNPGGGWGTEAVVLDEVVEAAWEAGYQTGLQPHEFVLHCLSDPGGVAVFDTHLWVREEAAWSIAYTGIVVLLILVFVMYFTTELNKMGTHVLFPLWDLLDDMASLKSFEVVCMGDIAPAQDVIASVRMSRLQAQHLQYGYCRATCLAALNKMKAKLQGKSKLQDAAELRELRASFSKMHSAMRSWTKYVPPLLCMQLFVKGEEATIAVQKSYVTIFFCDLHGFQNLCADLDPSETLDLLAKYYHDVSEIIEDNDGTLLEFIEDEILAVFNAPSPTPQHQEKAVRAAVDAQMHVARLFEGGHLRSGVHTAQVLVGNIGSPTRIKYGVLGDGVNSTARLKSLNSRYGTHCLVSDCVMENLKDPHEDYVTRAVGNLVLKGRTTPTRTWEVLCPRRCGSPGLIQGAAKHAEAYDLYLGRRFSEARSLFCESRECILNETGEKNDQLSGHFLQLCEQFMGSPPPDDWDGVERLNKK